MHDQSSHQNNLTVITSYFATSCNKSMRQGIQHIEIVVSAFLDVFQCHDNPTWNAIITHTTLLEHTCPQDVQRSDKISSNNNIYFLTLKTLPWMTTSLLLDFVKQLIRTLWGLKLSKQRNKVYKTTTWCELSCNHGNMPVCALYLYNSIPHQWKCVSMLTFDTPVYMETWCNMLYHLTSWKWQEMARNGKMTAIPCTVECRLTTFSSIQIPNICHQ